MNFLRLDVGTGGSRAVVIDMTGRVAAAATVEHQPFTSPHPGWAEQDPRDWWRASEAAIRAVLNEVEPQSIKAIGLSGQMHGSVLLDQKDEPLRPALIWCDQRTADQCRAITEKVGAQSLIELTCNPALTGFTLPKMLWVREHEPGLAQTRSVLLPKDYVRLASAEIKPRRCRCFGDTAAGCLGAKYPEMLAATEIMKTPAGGLRIG